MNAERAGYTVAGMAFLLASSYAMVCAGIAAIQSDDWGLRGGLILSMLIVLGFLRVVVIALTRPPVGDRHEDQHGNPRDPG